MGRAVVVLGVALVAASCGGDELSLTEYVEQVNEATAAAIAADERLMSEDAIQSANSPQLIAAGLRRALDEIRLPLQRAVDDIDPPDQVSELHSLLWDWHAAFIPIEEALLDRFDETPNTEAGWTALSNSDEMAAYRGSLVDGRQACIDFQAELDATEARGVFADVAWLPGELKETVVAALGCEAFPEDPYRDVWVYPPPPPTE